MSEGYPSVSRWSVVCVLALLLAALLPAAASAQQAQASVTGVVHDESGNVVPGVTVEVSSPALIEKVRTGVTDGRGQYRILDLPGGRYTVSFTLTGFSTYRREGIELEGSFTATINADLKVGALTETVTVSSETPIVNIQSAKREDVLQRDVITSLPISRDWFSLATTIPGVDVVGLTSGQDMGGLNLGEIVTTVAQQGAGQASGFRGFGEGRLQVDGLSTGGSRWGSGSGSFLPDISNAQEVQIVSSGGLGSAEVGGPVINVIPRSGGNKLQASAYYNFSNNDLQGNNINDELRAQNPNLPVANANVIKLQDVNGSFGGPIKKDRIWYFATIRNNRTDQWTPGVFFNKNANLAAAQVGLDGLYVPDYDRTAFSDARFREASLRGTWQANSKNKFTFSYSQQYRENNYNGGGSLLGSTVTSPEAGGTTDARPQTLPQVSWSSPISNHLLLEGGFSAFRAYTGGQARDSYDPITTRITQTNYNLPGLPANATVVTGAQQYSNNLSFNPRWRATAAVLTKGHSLRFGYDGFYSKQSLESHLTGDDGLLITINRLTGARSFTVTAVDGYPAGGSAIENYVKSTGLYVEDQWTMGRLTLQGALRYDYAMSGYPEQSYGPGRFGLVPNVVTFQPGKAVWGYKDLTPRVGAAYDLFGNGKTALKFNFGHYVSAASNDPPYQNNNPTASLSNTTGSRAWTDNDNDLIVDCDVANGAAQGPGLAVPAVDNCAAVNLGTLGSAAAATTVTDQSTLGGWNIRPSDFQVGAGVQQQVGRGISVEVTWRERWQNNFTYTDNLNIPNYTMDANGNISTSTYTEYHITSPLDGSVIGGLYDINSNTIATNNLVLGTNDQYKVYTKYQDVDVNVSARLKFGLVVRGGTQTGMRIGHTCGSNPDNPGTLRGCHTEQPWLTRYNGSATYLVPRLENPWLKWATDINLSATWSAIPTTVTNAANYTVPTGAGSEFQAQIGRAPLSGISPVVNLNDPSRPEFSDMRVEQNVRFSRNIRLGATRTNVGVDIFNFPNTSSVLARNNTYNPANLSTYRQATTIIPARFFKFSVQFDF